MSILSCSSEPFSIEIYNPLDISRQAETVEIDLKKIPESIKSSIGKIGIYDVDQATFLTKQLIDMNQDGVMDFLLFQPKLPPMKSKTFNLSRENGTCLNRKSCVLQGAPYVFERFSEAVLRP